MAKKTRKEKIIAQYRRKLQLLETKTEPSVKIASPVIDKPVKNTQEISQVMGQSENDLITKKYFVSDFKKSLVIIVTIVALEIGLYFATMLINKF